ncbi:hypothetical protein DUT91_14790 [Phyllobacterium salinisoli]|uniref:Uncharacterized protein n=1 Tax=Phyllobacterium salinisoli TaxID=1899321 RepID=A0A368K289_9HYPH|nr:hypothetical protein DUT91_14790 [Phyllobacterium salinisoli]
MWRGSWNGSRSKPGRLGARQGRHLKSAIPWPALRLVQAHGLARSACTGLSSGGNPIPLSSDGFLVRPRIFHDQPTGGPLASCGRSAEAFTVIATGGGH